MRAPGARTAVRVCSGHLLLPWHPSKQMALHPIPKQLLPPPLQNMPSPPRTLSLWSLLRCFRNGPFPAQPASPCLLTHLLIPGLLFVTLQLWALYQDLPPAPVSQPLLPAQATCPSCLSWERTGPNCGVGGRQRWDRACEERFPAAGRRSLLSGALTQTPSHVSHAAPSPQLAQSPRVASLEPGKLASLKIIPTGIWPVCKA